ncbi:hypothetical protein COOONC_16006, partial [Cooperia oncophora]
LNINPKHPIHSDHTNPFAGKEFETFLWSQDYGVTAQKYQKHTIRSFSRLGGTISACIDLWVETINLVIPSSAKESKMLPFFYGADSCEIVLKEHRDFFNRMVEEKFDLILTDTLFAVCAYGFATLNQFSLPRKVDTIASFIFNGARHVLYESQHTLVATGESMRAHGELNFVLTPRHYMPIHDAEFIPELFRHRLAGTVQWIQNFAISGILVGERMKSALASVVPSFSFFEYQRTASATFTDMPFDLIGPSPRTNDLFDYGAYCPTAKPLTGELLEFVSDPKSKGTILVAFGEFASPS